MNSSIGRFIGSSLVATAACAVVCVSLAASAWAGGHHHTAWGQTPPCGSMGCGPRYCGEKHEPSRPDPCDACGGWRGCNGVGQMPDMLAPWQLPPGRGFQSSEAVGYHAGPCHDCRGPAWSCWSPRSWWR